MADPVHIGWLWASLSVGILLTTMWLIMTKPLPLCHRVWIIAAAAAVAGTAALLLAGSPSLLLAAGLTALIGAGSGMVNPFVSASLQERSPKDLLARVFSLFNTGYLAFAMIGMTVVGWLADTYDPDRERGHDRSGQSWSGGRDRGDDSLVLSSATGGGGKKTSGCRRLKSFPSTEAKEKVVAHVTSVGEFFEKKLSVDH